MGNKNYRISTDISKDKVLNVKLDQDIDFLEVLSLKINQEDTYKLHHSNYGVIVGRVLANEAFGIPNAKVSVFIELDDIDKFNSEITNLYPYTSVLSNDSNGIRYNLLQDSANDICHQIVGTFPNKRLVLDNDTILEVFDKYWKYTTVSNKAGDYMIFGVPIGSQQVHVDIDLSDIGILSQKPRDMIYKGYNITQFENSNQFKSSTNLDGLSQLYSQNDSVFVYPFWGDSDANEIAITRCDIQIQYKFEPTCVFMGSVITDNFSNNIGYNCSPSKFSGFNRELVTAEGTIETIRKTVDGLVEELQVQGNRLINGDGVWCYQIPMNLDYVGTDEYGNIIPTDNPKKGIATKTSVRFRVSVQETESDGVSRHRAKYLVPNNPPLGTSETPKIKSGKNYDNCYEFGSATQDEDFRDLYWNKVYSVKSYIPRIQSTSKDSAQNYNALRTTNSSGNNNPIPFNKVRFRMVFGYRLLCMLMTIVTYIIVIVNTLFSGLACACIKIFRWKVCPFKPFVPACISFSIGVSEDEEENVEYFPGCFKCGKMNCRVNPCRKETDVDKLMNTVQQTLSQEYDIINLDFANDWINGTLYAPLWYWRKTKKKKFFFGLFSKKAINSFCSCDKNFPKLRIFDSCSLTYRDKDLTFDGKDGGGSWHKEKAYNYTNTGIVKEIENNNGLRIYYYAPGLPKSFNYKNELGEVDYVRLYSTDIILLGSLNSCDLDGLPQPFLNLPTTTANIPFIVTIKQSGLVEEGETYLEGTSNEAGVVEVTGMDWLDTGKDDKPKYGQGLLFDLGCTSIYTKPKTCINVERMCELGVGLDILYQESVAANGNILTNDMKSDGLITRYELLDNDTRSMFASLNHYGLQRKVFNKNTGYDSYKLHYIYPVDFDGRMSNFSPNYTNSMKFKTYDTKDNNYVNYRMGPDERHFYENTRKFPLYNNSFYFYFGLKDGSTAIDRFNELFFSQCYRNTKYPFLLTVTKTPAKWCISEDKFDTDYGMIEVRLDSIKTPYSYSLNDEFGSVLISENSMYNTLLIFGAKIDENGEYEKDADGNLLKDGRLQYFNIRDYVDPQAVLVNGVYKLVITDNKGQSVTQIINVEQSPINLTYSTMSLGTKYFPEGETEIEDICNDSGFYGNIIIKEVIIDGLSYVINSKTNVTEVTKGSYDIVVTKEGEKNEKVRLELYSLLDENLDLSKVLCNNKTGVNPYEVVDIKEEDGTVKYELHFNVWVPGDYKIVISQYCNGVLSDNSTNVLVNVANGKLFEMFLNDVPVRFILGKNEDVSKYNYRFYRNDVNIPSDLKGWFMTHKETAYLFPEPIESIYNTYDVAEKDKPVWENYIGSLDMEIAVDGDGNPIDDVEVVSDSGKFNIIKYKIDSLFNLSSAAYITELSSGIFRISHNGGKSPILYRSVYPMYNLIQDDEPLNEYIADSIGYSVCDTNYPTVVGNNYCENSSNGITTKIGAQVNGPFFNTLLATNNVKDLGNYFAAFTQNGITNKNLNPQQIPNNANVLYNKENMTEIPNVVVRKEGKYNPYLRTEYIDRRLDYDFLIFTPYSGSAIRLGDCSVGATGLWKNGRLSGNTINGIEMAYDKSYNIIGDDLEYNIKLDEMKVSYNEEAKNNRELYSLSIKSGGKTSDLRGYGYSNDKTPSTTVVETGIYSLNHGDDKSLYNGEFDENNYPIRRLYDVVNIPGGEKFTLSASSCSYTIELIENENNTLNGIIESDGEISFDIDCRNMINQVSSSLETSVTNKSFNVLYSMSEGLTFVSKVFMGVFNVKNDSYNDTHLCQTKKPKFIKVKTDKINNLICDIKNETKLNKIEELILNNSFELDVVGDLEGVKFEDGFLVDENDEKVFDDSNEFKKITYSPALDVVMADGGFFRGANLNDVDVFSLLIDRRYFNNGSDNTSKSIRAIEFGSLYDCRKFNLEIKIYRETVDSEEIYTPPEEKPEDPDVPEDPDAPEDTGSTETVLIEAQFFDFTIKFDGDDYTDAFNSKDNTEYSVRFQLKNQDVFISNNITVEYDTNDVDNPKFVKLTTYWNGALTEKFIDIKTAPVKTQIFVKASNGLIYAFGFQINADNTISSL